MTKLFKLFVLSICMGISLSLLAQGPYQLEMVTVEVGGSKLIDTIGAIPNGGAVYAGKDRCVIKLVRNPYFDFSQMEDGEPLYYTIFDLQPDGVINQVVPKLSNYENPQDFMITKNSSDELLLFNTLVQFTPPYGRETFIILFSKEPVSFVGNRGFKGLSRGATNIISTADLKWVIEGNPISSIGQVYLSFFNFEIRPEEAYEELKWRNNIVADDDAADGSEDDWGDEDDFSDSWDYDEEESEEEDVDSSERVVDVTWDSEESDEPIDAGSEQTDDTHDDWGDEDDTDEWGDEDDGWADEAESEDSDIIIERHLVKNDEVYVKYPILTMLNPPEPTWATSGRNIVVEDFEVSTTAFVVKGMLSSKNQIREVIITVKSLDFYKLYELSNFRIIPQGMLFEQQVKIPEGEIIINVKATTTEGYATTQDFKVNNTPKQDEQASGKDYLLVMSVNDYKHWPKLSNAVNDAQTVKQLLIKNYGFADSLTFVLEEKQCTRRSIDSTFRSLMRSLNEEDRLMVYFAGHGYYDSLSNVGYWIPWEAETGEYSTYSYVSNSIISEYIKGLKTKHTLFVSDACFSGDLCVGDDRGIDDRYTTSVSHFKSRWVFSSGRSEVVADDYMQSGHSPFAYFLISYMENPPNEVFTISEMASSVTRSVSNNANQTPMARAIKNSGDEGGEFVFRYEN
ncbi:MAG: caspase family protein [Bacteroidia bacterium]